MKLTFLGTGTSTGVLFDRLAIAKPAPPDDPRDKRLRVSVLIEHAGQTIIVDTSSDFRQQALKIGLRHLGCCSHHTLSRRSHLSVWTIFAPSIFVMAPSGCMRTSAPGKTSAEFFSMCSEPTHFGGGLPQIVPHTVVSGAPFCLGQDLEVTPLEVIHGRPARHCLSF